MAVHPVRLDQGHRGGDAAEELVRDRLGRRFGPRRRDRLPVALGFERLDQPDEARIGSDHLAVAALEQPSPLRRDRVRILEVVLEQIARVAGVQTVDVHQFCCSRACYQSGWLVITATAMPTAEHRAPMNTAAVASRALRPPIATASSERTSATGT